MFVLNDFGVVICKAVRIKVYRSLSPVIITFNLSINALTLMCSFADYRRRFFPFFKWTAVTRPSSLRRKSELQVKELEQQRKLSSKNEVVSDRCEDGHKVSAGEIFIYPNIFIKMPPSLARAESEARSELPRVLKNKNKEKLKNKEPVKMKTLEVRNLEDTCKPISIRNNEQRKVRKWKFLKLDRRMSNLEENETSV